MSTTELEHTAAALGLSPQRLQEIRQGHDEDRAEVVTMVGLVDAYVSARDHAEDLRVAGQTAHSRQCGALEQLRLAAVRADAGKAVA